MFLYLLLVILVIWAAAYSYKRSKMAFKRFMLFLILTVIALILLKFGKGFFALLAIIFPVLLKFMNLYLRNFSLFNRLLSWFRNREARSSTK